MVQRIEQLIKLLESEPQDSFLNYALALEYAKLNEKEKAITIIQNILTLDENYLGAYYQLGQLFEQTNQPEKARDIYNKGCVVARRQKKQKTWGELQTALSLLDD